MHRELFVWYRCGEEQTQAVLTAATELLRRVAEEAGVSGRLLHRNDGSLTWMEHYRFDAQDSERVEAILAHAVFQVWGETLPVRHGEVFIAQQT